MINFVFDNLEEGTNCVKQAGLNKGGSNRFTSAPIMNRMYLSQNENSDFSDFFIQNHIDTIDEKKLTNYIIPIGVNNDPHNWAGGELSEHKDYPSLFDFLYEKYITDLQNKKALLIVDSSLEGYSSEFIFEFFHHECKRLKISPTQIIYVTGNSIIETCYEKWLKENPQDKKILTLGYSHFEFDTHCLTRHLPEGNTKYPPTFEEQVEYKTKNLDKIKLFSNLNKKPRAHRVYWYCLLYVNNMLKKGLVSMNKFDWHDQSPAYAGRQFEKEKFKEISETLPSLINGKGNEEKSTDYYVKRFNVEVALDSWVSVVSEAQYEDNQETVFISEKIFKSIAQSQPFLVLGNKNSLQELKKLGYKTFEDFFDEKYDTLDESNRFFKLLLTLKKIDKIEDKLSWYKSMKEIIEHNKNLISKNSAEKLGEPSVRIIKLVLGDKIKQIPKKLKKYVN